MFIGSTPLHLKPSERGPSPSQQMVLCTVDAMINSQKFLKSERSLDNETDLECIIKSSPGATIISPIVLSLAGIVGHIIALCYLHRSTRRSHNRTVFYVLLSTLIWTDFIGKLITTPPAILSYSFRRWVGGTKLCRFHGFCMGLIDLATHFLVSAMAIDRFICVRFCYFYKSNFTQCRARTALIGVWAFCLTFSSLPLFGIGEFEIQYPCTWCFINIHVKKSTLWYHQVYTNVFGLLNIMNIIIIFVCNVMVIGILLSVRMSRTRKFSASSRQLPVNTTQRELELQMSIVLFVITLVFLISWSPLDIRLFLNQIWPHTCQEDHVVDLIAVRLASFNQIIDPWAYIICRRVFTSKAWKHCRSFLVEKNISRRNRNSSNMNTNPNAEMSRAKFSGQSLTSLKKKCSSASSSFTLKRIDETKMEKNVFQTFSLKFLNKKLTKEKIDPKSAAKKEKENDGMNNKNATDPKHEEEASKDLKKNGIYLPSRKQFRIQQILDEFSYTRTTKMVSSKSAYTCNVTEIGENFAATGDKKLSNLFLGRRHSWSCMPSIYKHFRSRSTQTLDEQ